VYSLAVAFEAARVCGWRERGLIPVGAVSIATIHLGFGIGFLLGLCASILKIRMRRFEGLTR